MPETVGGNVRFGRSLRLEPAGISTSGVPLCDLRLVGDMPSDPVTRAIRKGVLPFQEPPDWPEEHSSALASLGETLSNVLAMAIRRGGLSFQEPPDWSEGLSAMCRVFGLNRRHHLFRAEPIVWAQFTEPQFTKGFAYFLGVPEWTKRIERTRALLKALGAAELGEDMSEVEVTAEALTFRNKRIDLLIEWKDSSGSRYAAIEAKIGADATSGQLSAYRKGLQERWPEHQPLLIVVSPKITAKIHNALQDNEEWRWTAWRDLLIAHERALSGEYDDDAYRQFRRTLWDQAG